MSEKFARVHGVCAGRDTRNGVQTKFQFSRALLRRGFSGGAGITKTGAGFGTGETTASELRMGTGIGFGLRLTPRLAVFPIALVSDLLNALTSMLAGTL